MPSTALATWRGDRALRLDELEAAHRSIGGTNRGRRFATQQLNRAYAVLLAGQFQGFCTTLYALSVDAIVTTLPPNVRGPAGANFNRALMLHRGNAGPGNIGNDFGRLGVDVWSAVYALHPSIRNRNRHLQELNEWRNAIAHDDFPMPKFAQGRDTVLHLYVVKSWRRACNKVATDMDECMRQYLGQLLGTSPW
jgi:hypothetical protein